MKKKSYFSLFCCLFILSSCSLMSMTRGDIIPRNKAYRYINLSSELEQKAFMEIRQLHPVAKHGGGGSMMSNIEKVDIYLVTSGLCDIDHAREVYLDCLKPYLEVFAQSEKIRPYLEYYPIDLRTISLGLAFNDQNGQPVMDGKNISFVFNSSKFIIYSVDTDLYAPSIKVLRETYEEVCQRRNEFKRLKNENLREELE